MYDFEGKKRLINEKRSLGVFASVEHWIAASDLLQHSLEEHSNGAEIRMKRSTLKALWENARNAQAQVLIDLASSTKVNSPCSCNSGKKFKKCCAHLIDLTRHS
ncbi:MULTISPECIES: SEC-C metal-binding domain-containing protein [Bradyrhizobium]|uniref:SEC-C metal-binding domain-containing protein n=1 Tax=Bradyrhizobium TaxID=374 RepID=UPI0010A97107|nr:MULTISPECIES: SEC-C metal-binding domain-containing protein [Bradyrhizobium]